MTEYTPSPASVPDRALAYLRTLPAGAEVVSAVLAEGAHVPPAGLKANMQGALNAGAVFVRQKGGMPKSPLFWSLVDYTKATTTVFPRSVFEPPVAAMNGAKVTLKLQPCEAFSQADGSQDSNGDAAIPPAKAGQDTDSAGRAYWVGKPGESLPLDPVEADEVVTAGKDRPQHTPKGDNRVPQVLKAEPATADATAGEARGKVMALEVSESTTGRGTVGAPALGASPVFLRRAAVGHADEPAFDIPQFITDMERGIDGMRAAAKEPRHFEIGIYSDGRMVLEIGPDRYELTAAEQLKMAEFCVRCGQ